MSSCSSEEKIKEKILDGLVVDACLTMESDCVQIDVDKLKELRPNIVRIVGPQADELLRDYKASVSIEEVKDIIVKDVRKELTHASALDRFLESSFTVILFIFGLFFAVLPPALEGKSNIEFLYSDVFLQTKNIMYGSSGLFFLLLALNIIIRYRRSPR
ncbi:hypothetical protein [Maridesulfovibrio ferrireducens]|uniref:hypothetical protein n=1 Tax=Maridesulfovibrio ferrireducens TaxID=246191 RepID=UPI001A29C43B|nr:hypothetical protein [Maridesulfovibrio ferrireducens]MBI9109893.1 hypothetical protein [Maridesulfovibrio ferrireducens]